MEQRPEGKNKLSTFQNYEEASVDGTWWAKGTVKRCEINSRGTDHGF